MLVILLLIGLSLSGLGVALFCAASCLGACADEMELGQFVLLDAARRVQPQAIAVPVAHQLIAVSR